MFGGTADDGTVYSYDDFPTYQEGEELVLYLGNTITTSGSSSKTHEATIDCYIDSMRSTYTIINDAFSCEWNSSKHVSSQWTHILSLTVHRYLSSNDFYFLAMFDGSGVPFYAD